MGRFSSDTERKIYGLGNGLGAVGETGTAYQYDAMNQLTRVVSYNGATPYSAVEYTYDAGGNPLSMTTGLLPDGSGTGETTAYTYDRFGQELSLTDPLGQTVSRTYNLNGMMLSETDRNGNVQTCSYDGLGRLLRAENSSDGTFVAYAYALTGQVKLQENNANAVASRYDSLGRLIEETENGNIQKLYTYDLSDNRKTVVLKRDNTIVQTLGYTYDKMERMVSSEENGAVLSTYTYDTNGNRASVQYKNGNREEYTYNLANLVVGLVNKSGNTVTSEFGYTYYLDGNQATKTEQSNGIAKLTAYTYDGLGRLLEEQEIRNGITTTIGYTYDRQNNRTAMTVTGAESSATTYVYDANNRLTEEEKTTAERTTTIAYTYDANGNQLTRGTALPTPTGGDETFLHGHGNSGDETLEVNTYDGFNRLTAVNNDQGNVYFTYNPDGLRHTKNTDENSLIQIWDGDQLVADLTDEGVVASYVRALNLVAADTASGRKYYLYNAHGDVVQLSDTDGLVLWYYEYDAFGNERDPHPDDTNPFRYCGEYFDKETGTIYLRVRRYNPRTGRFTQEDMYKGDQSSSLSLNYYTYCAQNPLSFRDPSGFVWVLLEYIAQKNGLKYSISSNNKLITVTNGKTTVSYANKALNDVHIVESSSLMKHFKLTSYAAEHQMYDLFKTVDHATLAWALKYAQKAKDAGFEHGTLIYRVTDPKTRTPMYGFGRLVGQSINTFGNRECDVDLARDSLPTGAKMVAGIHTHPSLGVRENGANPERFSGEVDSDFGVNRYMTQVSGDIAWSINNGVPFYLVTPNGDLRRMAPKMVNGNVRGEDPVTLYRRLTR